MFAERQAERQIADEAIDLAFSVLRAKDSEIDEWESFELAYAIAAHFRGAYRLAAVAAELSTTPKDRRSPTSLSGKQGEFGLEQLKRAYASVQAEPVRLGTSFGPIILKE